MGSEREYSNLVIVTPEDCLAVVQRVREDWPEAFGWWNRELVLGDWCHKSCLLEEVRRRYGHETQRAMEEASTALWLMGQET